MLILLLLVAYLFLGLPVVAWLAQRLAQANGEHTTSPDSRGDLQAEPEVAAR